MRQDQAVSLRMVYSGEGKQVFVSHAWRRLFGIRAPLARQFILEFLSTCRMSDTEMGLDVADTPCGRRMAPEKVTGVDLFYLHSMDRGTTNVPHLLAEYMFRHADERKSGSRLSGGHFIGHLAMHFGLVSDEGLRGLQVVTRRRALVVDLHELEVSNICTQEVAPEIPAAAHAPLPPPPAPQPRTMSQRIERVEEEMHDLWRDVVGL
ncbi:hypothetical protein Tco_0945529 [Tanacetum coccineum]